MSQWIKCSERMPEIGELNWRTGFLLLVTCEIGVIPAYYGFVSINGDNIMASWRVLNTEMGAEITLKLMNMA